MVRSSTERSNAFYAGCALWAAACYWLIQNDLGSIAFVASALFAIYFFGLREKFQEEDGPSAYSVFNKGGQAIMGGFTGEQFDEQMRGGMKYKNENKTKVDGDTPLTTTSASTANKKISDSEKLKRRSAAAAAAERRMQQMAAESG